MNGAGSEWIRPRRSRPIASSAARARFAARASHAAQVQSLAGGSCVLYRDGSANCLGMYRPMQIATDVAQIVTLIASGGAVYCVLGRSGGVRCGPEPLEGQSFTAVALDTGSQPVSQIAGSYDTLCGITAPDAVRCWTLEGGTGTVQGPPVDVRGLPGLSQLAVYDHTAPWRDD